MYNTHACRGARTWGRTPSCGRAHAGLFLCGQEPGPGGPTVAVETAVARCPPHRPVLALARISHRTGFLREGGEVQVTESRRDRRLSVAGGRKTACNATKRRIPTSVGILCLLRQAS